MRPVSLALFSSALLLLSSMTVKPSHGGPNHPGESFKIRIESKMEMDLGSRTQELIADSELKYTWTLRGNDRILSFDGVSTRAVVDGEEELRAVLSRAGVTSVTKGEKKEILFADAPDSLKAMLSDSFETPIYSLRVDDKGRETERKMLGNASGKSLIDEGTIGNARLFHPPYLEDQAKWDFQAQVGAGPGVLVRGKLVCEKDAKDNKRIHVTGVLSEESTSGLPPDMREKITKKYRYEVQGEMIFDSVSKEWNTGTLRINAKMEFANNGRVVASGQGTMTITFQRLIPKK